MANEYRLAHLSTEVLAAFPADARLAALSTEVLAVFPADARLAAISVEVLRTISSITTARRRQAMIGSF